MPLSKEIEPLVWYGVFCIAVAILAFDLYHQSGIDNIEVIQWTSAPL